MNPRRVPLIVGIVLALGTGFLLLNFLAQSRGSTGNLMRTVVVTTKDIPARALISADDVTIVQRSADQVDPDALDANANAAGQIALITMPTGSIVTKSKIASEAALALPMRLTGGLRAVSISIDRVKGVAGLIQPGDRVDVIAVAPRVSNENPKAMAILRGVLVLALGNETETASATPAPDNQNLTTVTLAVTPRQADLLALADVYTTLRLALRSPNEPIRSYPSEPLAFDATPPPAVAPVPPAEPVQVPAPAYAAPPPAAPNTVVVAAPPRPVVLPAAIPVVEGDRIEYQGGSNP